MTNFNPNLDHLQSDASITEASEFAERILIEYLRQYAEHRGLSQTEIAKVSGIKQSNISRLFAGKYPPTLRTFLRVAGALDMHLNIEAS